MQQAKSDVKLKLNFGMFTAGVEKTGQDYSNPMEDLFKNSPVFSS